MDISNSRRKFFGIFILYTILACSFLAPLASNSVAPISSSAYASHINLVKQAALALKERQFPIRVISDYNGFTGYPEFQFYSPLTFTIAGYIHKILIPSNPYTALKLTIWLGLIIAVFYIYFLTKQITQDSVAAILAGAAYMASPYLLINMISRGAFTELIGQCIVPPLLYYSCQPHLRNKITLNNLFITGLLWSILAMVHLITFVNTSITMALFLSLWLVFFKTKNSFKKLLTSGVSYIFGFMLAAWYLFPIIIYNSLLNISDFLANPMAHNFLTLFSRLVATVTIPLSPLSYTKIANQLLFTPPFYPSVGLVSLLSVGICVYVVWINPEKFNINIKLINLLLLMFVLTFFITWSPLNFWKYVPKILMIEQYPYRFSAQVVWISILLLSIAINIFSKGKNPIQTLVLGLIIICLSSSSWLTAEFGQGESVATITSSSFKSLYIDGNSEYLIKLKPQLTENNTEPVVIDHVLMRTHCSKKYAKLNCSIFVPLKGIVELPALFYPGVLKVIVDAKKTPYRPIKFGNYYLTAIKLSPGIHNISIKYTGLFWANWLSLIAGLILAGVFFFNLIKSFFKKIMLVREIYLTY